jgi:hypothetical protein
MQSQVKASGGGWVDLVSGIWNPGSVSVGWSMKDGGNPDGKRFRCHITTKRSLDGAQPSESLHQILVGVMPGSFE